MAKRGGKDPEQWLKYQKQLALAEESDRIVNEGVQNENGRTVKKTCGNCRKKKHCKLNMISTSSGAVSIGEPSSKICVEWAEQKKGNRMTDKQSKNLLKQLKKQLK